MKKQKILLIVFVIVMLAVAGLAWPTFFVQSDILDQGEGDYLPLVLHQGDQIVQQIKPTRNGLNQITLSFDLLEGQTLPESTQILFELHESGVSDPKEVLILKQDTLKVFARTEIPVDLPDHTAGKSYLLTLKVYQLDESSRLAIHTTLHSKTTLQLNNQATGLVTVLSLQYIRFNVVSFSLAILLIAALFMLIFFKFPRLSEVFKSIEVVPLLIAPFMTLATVELLNSLNTNFLMDAPVYWLSLVTVLTFELLFVSLFGQIRFGI